MGVFLRAASKVRETDEYPVVFSWNWTKSLLEVINVVPRPIPPLDPQEFVPSEKDVERIPEPGEATPAPLEGTGEAVLNPAGNVHCARERPHTGEGPGGVLPTVNVSVAELPVSSVPTNRWLVVLV